MNESPKPTPPTPADHLAIQTELLKKIEIHLNSIRTIMIVFSALVLLGVLAQARTLDFVIPENASCPM